jgi:hypothetical protein
MTCPFKKCPHFEQFKDELSKKENIEKCPYLKEQVSKCPHYNN